MAKKFKSPPFATKSLLIEDAKTSVKSQMHKNNEIDKKQDDKDLARASKQIRRMSNDKLQLLLSSEDEFILDCILDQITSMKKLQRERDELLQQVRNLANFNYAREPEFVRERKKLRETLDEVSDLKRRLASRYLDPVIGKLNKVQVKLAADARRYEEESESMAKKFLDGITNYEEFIEDYIKLRQETSQKRIVADKLAKETNKMVLNVNQPAEHSSPIPAPRQRRRASLLKNT